MTDKDRETAGMIVEALAQEGPTVTNPITQRSQMSYEQKLEILGYYLHHGRKAMRAKYSMTNQAASHLIYHDKAIIEALENKAFEKAGL